MFVYVHEQTHASIYNDFGCEDISFGINGDAIYTQADCSTLSQRKMLSLHESQQMVEAVGYQLGIALAGLFGAGILIVAGKRGDG
jgi:hypothetical protein